jgi:hypothetical protein
MERDKKDPKFTGWANTDALNHMECPNCKQPAGKPCRTPKGRKTSVPHGDRRSELFKKYSTSYWMISPPT